ncbi:MAG TPA: hypothetical protein VFN13_02140 [Rudaea sp.]|nr:hypothetical protein [Rudaea sp.]
MWDILLGTFCNPPKYRGKSGFENRADRRLLAMLVFADVNAGIYGANRRGRRPHVRHFQGTSRDP